MDADLAGATEQVDLARAGVADVGDDRPGISWHGVGRPFPGFAGTSGCSWAGGCSSAGG